jgi:hypothetical protein
MCGEYHSGTDQTGCLLVQISLVLCALLVSGFAAESGENVRELLALTTPQQRLCVPPVARDDAEMSPIAAHSTDSVARSNRLSVFVSYLNSMCRTTQPIMFLN